MISKKDLADAIRAIVDPKVDHDGSYLAMVTCFCGDAWEMRVDMRGAERAWVKCDTCGTSIDLTSGAVVRIR